MLVHTVCRKAGMRMWLTGDIRGSTEKVKHKLPRTSESVKGLLTCRHAGRSLELLQHRDQGPPLDPSAVHDQNIHRFGS